MPVEMEGSMKMMSWSRYHCLSWSPLRAARQHRAMMHKIRRRHHAVIGIRALSRLLRAISRPDVSNS
jgi:hypothetical protein